MTMDKEYGIWCATESISNLHDAIIQTLDRFLGYDQGGYPLYFPSEVYEAALSTIEGAKIVYALDHPDFDLYDQDPEQAVREVGGNFAGSLTNPRIDATGHPTVQSTLVLDANPDIEKLIADGKLSMSPSLGVTRDDQLNIVKLRFQNLLIFPEVPGGRTVPKDPGTKILNAERKTMMKIRKTEDENLVEGNTQLTAELAEMKAQFTAMKAETDRLKAEAEAAKKEASDLKEANEKSVQMQKEKDWKGLVNSSAFPAGWKSEADWEKTKRAAFEENPAQFTKELIEVVATQEKQLEQKGKEEGQQFTGQNKQPPAEAVALWTKMGLKPDQFPKEW